MTLGAWSSLTREERVEKIRTHKCVPTPDPATLHLLRVVWLHHVHQTFELIRPWKRVLDIGCHDGFGTRWMVDEPHVEQLVGLDLCTHAICWANELIKIREYPEKALYINEDWLGSPEMAKQDTNSFDAIVCFELIEHLDLEEIKQLFHFINWHLAPGGIALLTTPNIDGPIGRVNPDEQHINLFSVERLTDWVLDYIKNYTSYDVRLDLIAGAHIHLMWRKIDVA